MAHTIQDLITTTIDTQAALRDALFRAGAVYTVDCSMTPPVVVEWSLDSGGVIQHAQVLLAESISLPIGPPPPPPPPLDPTPPPG